MRLKPLLVAALLAAGLLPGLPAQAEAGLSVDTVPAVDRWDGRHVQLVAASEQGMLLDEEGLGCTWYPTSGDPVAADCQAMSVHAFGTLLVSDEERGTEEAVLRTQVPGAGWQPYVAPVGSSVVAPVAEGVLLQQADGTLTLQPWDGTAAVSLSGLPDGTRLQRTSYSTSDATGVLALDQANHSWLVEASQRRVLPLDGYALALGPTSVLFGEYTPDGHWDLVTRARPAEADAPLGEPVVRPAPPQAQRYDVQLLPLGDEVVLSRRGQGRRDEQLPVTVLDADGAVRDLLPWAVDVQVAPGHPDELLAVTGAAPRERAVTTTPIGGGPSSVLRAEPLMPAMAAALVLDDDRLVVVDDSEARGAVAEHPLGDLTTRRVLATDAQQSPRGTCGDARTATCRLVVAGGGATAYDGRDGVQVVRADGSNLSPQVGDDPGSTDGSYVAGGSGGLTRLSDGTSVAPLAQQSVVAVADGVTYALRQGFPDQLLTRDLRTGATGLVPLPAGTSECWANSPIDVAGSALLLTGACNGPVLVDLTGARAPQVRPDLTALGNGFGVALRDGHLSWIDAAGAAHPVADGVTAYAAGTTSPTLAWVTDGIVHVARVPVPPSAPAPHPAELLAVPAAPVITMTPYASALSVFWAAPPADQHVDSWTVTLSPGGATRTIPADRPRSWTFAAWTLAPVENGTPYTVRVTATNRVGTGAAGSATATPLRPPPPVTALKAVADPDTQWTTVTWSYADGGSDRSPATSFEVSVNGAFATLPVSARSVRLHPLRSGAGSVAVRVDSTTGSSTTDIPFTVPLADTAPPLVTLSEQPPALVTGSTTVRWSGWDDHRVVSYDVRSRTAPAGTPLGAWTYPSAQQGRTGTSLAVTGLSIGSTTCWSVRGRDPVGNVGAWSPSTCTTVASDERVLSASTSWTRSTGSAYYRGTLLTTSKAGATATLPRFRAGGLGLVVTRCSSCGDVAVYDDKTLLAAVDTAAGTTKHQQVLWVRWSGIRTGTLTLKVLSGQVRLDGIALRATS